MQVLPAKNVINDKTKQLEQEIEDFWSDDSLKFFKKLIDSAEQIYFRPSQSIKDEFIVFGELIVEQGGELIEVDEELLRMQLAMLAPNDKFLSLFDRSFSAIIERWNDNNQSGEILNQPDSVLFACIASNTPDEAQRWLQKRKVEEQFRKEADNHVKESINKVMEWQKKNEGIQPEDILDKNDTTLDEAFVEVEPLPASKVPLKSSGTSHSSVSSQALAVKTRKDFQDFLARKRATLEFAERTASPDTNVSARVTKCSTQISESKRPPKKMISYLMVVE